MKKILLIICCIFSFTFILAFLYTKYPSDKTIRNLVQNNLIHQTQVLSYEIELAQIGCESNSCYLRALLNNEFDRLSGGFSNRYQYATYNFEDKTLTKAERVAKRVTLSDYLSKLAVCQLITESIRRSFQIRINNNEFVHPIQLLTNIIEQVSLQELLMPQMLKPYAIALKNKGIIDHNFDNLLKNIESNKLQSTLDLLNYSSKAVLINYQEYDPKITRNYLEKLLQKIAKVLPELSFHHFESKIIVDSTSSENENKDYQVTVSLTVNGHKYQQLFKHYANTDAKYDVVALEDYYKVFNKILVDIQSPYRLHLVKVPENITSELHFFGIMALTKEQEQLLKQNQIYLTTSLENFEKSLTTSRVEVAIKEYQNIGLLAHLSPKQTKEAKERILSQDHTSLNDILKGFPDVFLRLDAELQNLQDPYASLVKELKQLSHNEFYPIDVSDNFDINNGKSVVVKFKIKNKNYQKILKIEDDWIDIDFFSFIDSVVKEQKLKGKFYSILSDSQIITLIYLTNDQYIYLKKNKLIEFSSF
ncbi:hypothetical protein [Flectobacillus roseus]|uniref:Uncharacterized protein n=1 Tax=Flectobacillus roseus TaxID=502259 RepID=A0ABT6Y3L7_9BACT|nr:hypothetical protein [Flectobacillus roseus]MDI9858167.1 hypothetical protein [Flectobacillus roseus]